PGLLGPAGDGGRTRGSGGQATPQRERPAGAGRPGREGAVEPGHPGREYLDPPPGVADPHEVARLRLGQERRGVRRGLEHRHTVLADAQAADRIAVEVERDELFARPPAKLGIEAALRDREAKLSRRTRQVTLTLDRKSGV